MEYLGGENWQERRRSAEQHREQIQQLRTEQFRLFHQKANPHSKILSNRSLADNRWQPGISDLSEQKDGHRAQHSFDDIRQARSGKPVKNSSRGRADDGGELPKRGAPGDGIGVGLAWHDLGAQRSSRGLKEAARESAHANDCVDRQYGPGKKASGVDGEHQQRSPAAQLHRQRDDRKSLSVVTIGVVTGIERSAYKRQCFSKPDQSERKRILRQCVNLPRDHSRLDLRPEC